MLRDLVLKLAPRIGRRNGGGDERRFWRDRVVPDHAPDLLHEVVLDRDVLGGAPRGHGDGKHAGARLVHAELQPLEDIADLGGRDLAA